MRTKRWVFAPTIFLSAFLLFQVQLIISKHILPWFGGSASVWTTNMLVFQTLLLAGYLYAHFVSQRLKPETQGRLHLLILSTALLLIAVLSWIWPSAITPGLNWRPAGVAHPVRDVIFITLLATGLPFFALSTTGPLLQRWFVQQGGDVRTYRLYSVSNLGSLLGLLSFPFLLEPFFRLKVQGAMWSVLFVVFCCGCGLCAWAATKGDTHEKDDMQEAPASTTRTSPLIRTLWFLLAACASAQLLAATNQLCQEIVSMPLLWVLPLALYLVSFILCFDHPRWYRREIFHPLFAVSLLVLLIAMVYGLMAAQIVLLPLVLFASCMICHGELVRLRPHVSELTLFYLTVSAGGVFGSLLVAIVSPRVFRFFTEYQISLGVCCVLLLFCLYLDKDSWLYAAEFWVSFATASGLVVAVIAVGHWIPAFAQDVQASRLTALACLVPGLALLMAYIQRNAQQPWRRSISVQVLVGFLVLSILVALYESIKTGPELVLAKRNFYGALRVLDLRQHAKVLYHTRTIHGAQMSPPYNRIPTLYFGPKSGIGILLQNHPKRLEGSGNLRVAIVGLGAGTLAAYGKPGDYFRYYEINPQVVELSEGTHPVFTYLQDSQATVETRLGDARLLLEREAQQPGHERFDVLILDAFSGDAVPVHLLTKEAFEIYSQHLKDDGILALHLSTRYINLLPVVEGYREYSQAYSVVKYTEGSDPYLPSLWVFLAKRPETLHIPGLTPRMPPIPQAKPILWTDDHSDVLQLLY